MLELARTGKLGPIAPGMTHRELRDVLGPPVAWDAETGDRTRIWQYGDVELHFDNWVVHLIFSDHRDLTDGGPTLRIDPWIVRRGLPCEALQQRLTAAGVDVQVAVAHYDAGQRLLTTEAGVVFSFLDSPEDGDRPGLCSWSTRG